MSDRQPVRNSGGQFVSGHPYAWQPGQSPNPGGNYKHTTSCDKSSDCVFFVESGGAFDLKPVEAPKPPAKK